LPANRGDSQLTTANDRDAAYKLVTSHIRLRSARLVSRQTLAGDDVRGHVIDRRMNMGDAMMLGRGRRCEGGAENNGNGKRNFHLAEYFRISFLRCAVAIKQLDDLVLVPRQNTLGRSAAGCD
jgi:hypothetical protein